MVAGWLLKLQPSGAIIQSRKKEERERTVTANFYFILNYPWPPREGVSPSSKVDSGKGKS